MVKSIFLIKLFYGKKYIFDKTFSVKKAQVGFFYGKKYIFDKTFSVKKAQVGFFYGKKFKCTQYYLL